jgi:hypothetical protein
MKLRIENQRRHALTVWEVMVVGAVLFMLVMVLLPVLAGVKRHSSPINCVSNLKQDALAFRIWEGDNNNKYPMAVSVTNGGAMESVAVGDVAACFLVMSNELSVPQILICPEDSEHVSATNFGNDFNSSHISYFVSPDVTNEDNPTMILTGDDNFALGGVTLGSGVSSLPTNATVVWASGRHGDIPRHFWTTPPRHFVGNIGYADGSVSEVSDIGLETALQQTGMATNRFAIP